MRICHLSDLHFGRHAAALAGGLMADLTSQTPDLVIVSGDFTQLGTEEEFRAARSFLDTLATPVAQIEAVLAHALGLHGASIRGRIEEIETIRSANAVTLDGGDDAERAKSPGDRIPPRVAATS